MQIARGNSRIRTLTELFAQVERSLLGCRLSSRCRTKTHIRQEPLWRRTDAGALQSPSFRLTGIWWISCEQGDSSTGRMRSWASGLEQSSDPRFQALPHLDL